MNKEKHSDSYYLKMALAEAKKGRYTTSPNPAVGCVIVRNNKILGMGFHHCAGQPHAEIMALKAANYDVEGATCYVTLEPCSHYGRTPPCAQALIDAKVKKVVIGSTDPNPKVSGNGIKMLLDAHIDVVKATGKLNKECLKLNRAFFKSITTNRPFTILKYGMSLDGKVALSSNESKWITNDQCRADVQRLRLWSDAVITSYKTVLSDNPKLNVRLEDLPIKLLTGVDTTLIKQPIKVILDSKATLLPNKDLSDLDPFAIFSTGENYIVVGSNEVASSNERSKSSSKKGSVKKSSAKSSSKANSALEDDSYLCCSKAQLDALHKLEGKYQQEQSASDNCSELCDSPKGKTKSSSAKDPTKKTASKTTANKDSKSTTKATSKEVSKATSKATTKEASKATSKSSVKSEPKEKSLESKTKASTKSASKAEPKASSKEAPNSASKSTSESLENASKQPLVGEALDLNSDKSKGSRTSKSKKSTSSKLKVANKKAKELVLDTKNTPPCGVDNEVYGLKSWKIDESKVVLRGDNFVVEKWSDRVYIVVVPFALGTDNKPHASINATLDFLSTKDVRVAMVEAGSSLGSAFLEQGFIDECYCYMSPMILGVEAKSAFAIHEPSKLCDALKFKKCKVKTFKSNIGLILSDPVSGGKKIKK